MNNAYKIFYCSVLLFVFMALSYFIKSYFKPTLIIFILYLSALPLFNFLFSRLKKARLSSVISLIIVNSIILVFLSYVGTYLVDMVISLVLVDTGSYTTLIQRLLSALNISYRSIWQNLSKLNNPLFIKSALFTGEVIIVFFISNITVYFLLSDKPSVISFIKLFLKEKYLLRIKESLYNLKELLTIELILVLLSTLLTLLGFLLFGIEDAVMLSIICGLLDILPYVGTVIVFIPLILYNIVIKEYMVVVGLILLYILISLIRQILETKYIGSRFSIHPLLIVLSLYLGIQLFGIFGLFMGPLYVIMAKEIILN